MGAVVRLLSVPNFSEGREPAVVDAIAEALASKARLHDIHVDADHNRSVFTLTSSPRELTDALLAGARIAVERIDLRTQRGAHPRVGALDVAPIVYRTAAERGRATAVALVLADRLASELALPVFLYGELSHAGHTRAVLRRGGVPALAGRLAAGELKPDFGPAEPHSAAGGVLVAARPPLVAFNLELAPPATLEDARRIAGLVREGGPEGLPGVRAIAVALTGPDRVQVSTNVEDHLATPLVRVVAGVRRHAEVARAELVGLAPRAAFAGFPEDVEVVGRRHLEDVLDD